MKRFSVLLLSMLVVLTLLGASCQKTTTAPTTTTSTTESTSIPASTQATTTAQTIAETTQVSGHGAVESNIKSIATVPKYGGTLTLGATVDVVGFDPKFILQASTWTVHLTNERLTTGDWAKGPAGSGEEDWLLPAVWKIPNQVNLLIESWELPALDTIILKVKKGVYWQNKSPANARQMDAADVVYSIERHAMHTDSIGYPKNADDRLIYVKATDSWTVEVKYPVNSQGAVRALLTGIFIFPKELGLTGTVTSYKDEIGTGPFILSDYVPNSSVTMRKNPDYWRNDPVHPENRLPYTDYVRALVIADDSTRLAALVTGKIDVIRGVAWDSGKDAIAQNSDLQYMRYLAQTSNNIFMRIDKQDLPYKDIRVRRALFMAIDREGIISGYYQGNAVSFTHPTLPVGALSDMFIPLTEMPATVQENYTYNVAKAKQLLNEAGYPNGFKATIICSNTTPHTEILTLVKSYWAKINVELTLDVKENATYTSIQRSRAETDMVFASITNIYYYAPLAYLYDQSQYNRSWGKDDYVENYYRNEMMPLQGPLDDAKLRAKYKALAPYLADLVWLIPLPQSYLYCEWQPWVGGYHGEYSVGDGEHDNYPIYLWVDNDIKNK